MIQFVTLLLMVFMLEAVLGGMSFLVEAAVKSEDIQVLDEYFVRKYGREGSEFMTAVDSMQQRYSCCGSNSFQDWTSSEWRSKQDFLKVPDSCCKTMSPGCGRRDHPSNIAYTGCTSKVTDMILESLGLLTLKSIIMCAIECVGLIVAICFLSLSTSEKTWKEREKRKPVMVQGYWRTK